MAANGASLVALKEFLGHKRMTTTERYLHVTPQHLKDSLKFLKATESDLKLK
jgi:site-specific recombinase XerD